MNLLKNVTGTPKQALEKIRQDLDTIQRNFNDLFAQVNAPIPPQPDKPAIIAGNNAVTIPERQNAPPVFTGSNTVTVENHSFVSGLTLYQTFRDFNSGEIRSMFSSPITVINRTPGTIILPIASMWYVHQVAAYGTAVTGSLQYTGNTTARALTATFTISFGASTGELFGPRTFAAGNNFDGVAASDGDPRSAAVMLKTANDITGDPTNANSGKFWCIYALLPGGN